MMGGAHSSNKASKLPDVDVKYSENNYPPFKPPRTKKAIVFNPRLCTTIDEKARLTPRQYATSYEGLIKYLTDGLQNDIQKIRSIYVWLASQHIMEDNYDDTMDVNTPLGYMRLMQEERGTYEQIFALLCRTAKLPCVVVQGNIKSMTYEVGDMDIECVYGYWNLVYLDGSWRIINPKWAMVSIDNYNNERWQMIEKDGASRNQTTEQGHLTYVYNQDDFYFLTDPEEHIFTCLPCNSKYQLLEDPWTMGKFQNVPLVENEFFTSGLKLPDSMKGIIKATKGEVEINLEVSKATQVLKYELYFEQKKQKKLQGQTQLSRYVFVNSDRNMRSFFVRLHTEGLYRLTILSDKETQLCSFRIDCTGVQKSCEPFPKNPDIGWGYGENAKKAGLSNPSQEDGVVTIDSKKSVNFTFDVQKDLQVKANLLHNEIPKHELDTHVSQQKDGDKLTVRVDVPTVSAKKEYALEINAKKKGSDSYKNVANYLLTTESKQPKTTKWNSQSRNGVSGSSPDDKSKGTLPHANGTCHSHTEATVPQKKGLFGRFSLLSKGSQVQESKIEVVDETQCSDTAFANGSVPSKHRDLMRKGQPHTSQLAKNKTYSFKIKPDSNAQGVMDPAVDMTSTEKDTNRLSPANNVSSDTRRASGSSQNANSISSRRSSWKSPVADPATETDFSFPARIKRMKDAYLSSSPTGAKPVSPKVETGTDSTNTDHSLSDTSAAIAAKGELKSTSEAVTDISGKTSVTKQTEMSSTNKGDYSSAVTVTAELHPSQHQSREPSKFSSTSSSNTRPFSDKGTQSMFAKQRANAGISRKSSFYDRGNGKTSNTNSRPSQQSTGTETERKMDTLRSPSIPVRKSPIRKKHVDNLCQDLQKAIESRQLEEINKILEETGQQAISPNPKLTELKAKAESVRSVIKRLNKYLHDVMSVNQGTIAEIHSYSHPKPVVHDVMRATFLLLGERGSQLRKWHYVQQLMRRSSKEGLIMRIQEFDIHSISLDLAEYVKEILDHYDQDEVRLTSAGAGAFYNWVGGMKPEAQNIVNTSRAYEGCSAKIALETGPLDPFPMRSLSYDRLKPMCRNIITEVHQNNKDKQDPKF